MQFVNEGVSFDASFNEPKTSSTERLVIYYAKNFWQIVEVSSHVIIKKNYAFSDHLSAQSKPFETLFVICYREIEIGKLVNVQ